MELKAYNKSWLPAFKGALLIIFGIVAMLQISGTIKSLAIVFSMLVIMIGILLLSSTVLFGKYKYPLWTIVSGILHLVFAILLITQVDAPRETIVKVMIGWVLFNAVTEIAEAGILVTMKNAFAVLFIQNALFSLLFGYFLSVLVVDITPEKVFRIGLIALAFGLANEVSAYLLTRIKAEK
jgi:uncharacterized membrane protein HdeD (DUF308 family)